MISWYDRAHARWNVRSFHLNATPAPLEARQELPHERTGMSGSIRQHPRVSAVQTSINNWAVKLVVRSSADSG